MSRKSKAAEFVNEKINVTVVGRNFTVTEALKNYAIEKVSKIEKFTHRILDISITLEIQKLDQKVDLVVKLDQIKIKSQAVTEDMYASIDKAVHKLEAQLLRYKDKLQEHHAKSASSIDLEVNVIKPLSNTEEQDINDEIEISNRQRLVDKYTPHRVVAKKTMPLKILTDGEALMKLELSGDPFLIYRAEDSRHIKVMYRRKDDHFCVVQLEG